MTNYLMDKNQPDLVFDLGFHRGEDTGYYLTMGRQVVAVDASAELIAAGRKRFATALETGQLKLVNAAVVGADLRKKKEKILFYPHNERSEWGSVDLRWVRRNAEVHGMPNAQPVWVPTICLEELVRSYGCPSFLKIDIEGADEAVLADVSKLSAKPNTLSWETGKESLRNVLAKHRLLAGLGYREFRVVQQAWMHLTPRAKGRDGRTWSFEPGCSGTLPDSSSSPWRSLVWVSAQYILLFMAYRLVGPNSWFRSASRHRSPWINGIPRLIQRWADKKRIPLPGWVDSHARIRPKH